MKKTLVALVLVLLALCTAALAAEEVAPTVLVTGEYAIVGFDTGECKDDGHTHIGISNVKSRLAAQCGGTLTIESTPGEGTTVKIILPEKEVPGHEHHSGGR